MVTGIMATSGTLSSVRNYLYQRGAWSDYLVGKRG